MKQISKINKNEDYMKNTFNFNTNKKSDQGIELMEKKNSEELEKKKTSKQNIDKIEISNTIMYEKNKINLFNL